MYQFWQIQNSIQHSNSKASLTEWLSDGQGKALIGLWLMHWLVGPINTRSMRLNCILQDLLRDTPLDHIWRAQNAPKYAFLAYILVRQVWSSGVSLKRSYRMQFRRVGLRWIGPSIYGSIMLKIYVCHSLTKLLQFFTWERGKKKFSWPTYCSCYQYIFKQLKTSNRADRTGFSG